MRMIVMGVGMGVVSMRRMGMIAVIMPMIHFVATRVARMRPEYRDQAGQNGAQQRQKDDCLNHSWVSPSSD